MLAEIRGGTDDLRLADIVILNEDDRQEITDFRVLVHHGRNLVDEVDDGLRHPVARSSLATNDGDARHHLLLLLC